MKAIVVTDEDHQRIVMLMELAITALYPAQTQKKDELQHLLEKVKEAK